MNRADIERISLDVMLTHGCHTAVLYGSWAHGQATATSDIDLLYVRRDGPDFRDARILNGIYLDAFIYSEASIAAPDAGLMRVLGGCVLRETDSCGTVLLTKLQSLYERGPESMSDDARNVALVWSGKMLDRLLGQSGLEANYRRMELFTQSLEDYFSLRGLWFLGPKAAFSWLRQRDGHAHEQFERAAQPDASDADFAELVRAVYGPFKPVG